MKHDRILSEMLVSFDDARKELPGKPSRNQLDYWRRAGVIVKQDGFVDRIRLECCLIGGRRHTSREAYLRFLEKINE